MIKIKLTEEEIITLSNLSIYLSSKTNEDNNGYFGQAEDILEKKILDYKSSNPSKINRNNKLPIFDQGLENFLLDQSTDSSNLPYKEVDSLFNQRLEEYFIDQCVKGSIFPQRIDKYMLMNTIHDFLYDGTIEEYKKAEEFPIEIDSKSSSYIFTMTNIAEHLINSTLIEYIDEFDDLENLDLEDDLKVPKLLKIILKEIQYKEDFVEIVLKGK